jgi:hypothetical protein
MKYRWLILFLLSTFSQSVFSFNFPYYYYAIENNSDEDIFFTALSSEALRKNQDIPYYEDGIESGYLVPTEWDEIIKRPIYSGTTIDPNISIDSTHFGIILTTYTVVRVNDGRIEYMEPDGTDVIKTFFDQLIIYSSDGSIVLTIDDLKRNSSFIKQPGKGSSLIFTLIITQDMIKAGKEKYSLAKELSIYFTPGYFTPGVFDIDLKPNLHMIQTPPPLMEQFQPHYTFTDSNGSYQIWYTFFKQIETDLTNAKVAYMYFFLPFVKYINENNINAKYLYPRFQVDEKDARNVYNGDYRTSFSFIEPNQDYGSGYKRLELNFFYKKNRGIVIQSILYNELDFVYTEEYREISHSFKFYD